MVTSILPLPSTAVAATKPALADHGLWRDIAQNKTKAQVGADVKNVADILIDGQPIKAAYRNGVALYQRKLASSGTGSFLDEGVLLGNPKASANLHTLSHARSVHLEAGEEYTVWVSGKITDAELTSRVIFDLWDTQTPPVIADPESSAAALFSHTFIPPKTVAQVAGDFGTATAAEGYKFTATRTGDFMVTFRLLGPLPNLAYAITANAGSQPGLKTQYHREFAGTRTDAASVTTTERVHVFHPGTFNSPVSHWTWENKTVTTVSPDHGVPTGDAVPHGDWSAITQSIGVQFRAGNRCRIEAATNVELTGAANIGMAIYAYPRGTAITAGNVTTGAIAVTAAHPKHAKGSVAQGSQAFTTGVNCVADWIEFDYVGDIDVHIFIYVDAVSGVVAKVVRPAFVLTAFGDPANAAGPTPNLIKLWRSIPEMLPAHPGSAHLIYQKSSSPYGDPVTVTVVAANGGTRTERFTNPFDVTLLATKANPITAVIIGDTKYNIDGTTSHVASQADFDAFIRGFQAAASQAVVDATTWIRGGWDADLANQMAGMPHSTRAQCMAVYQVAYDQMTRAINSGNAWASGRRSELIAKLQWMNMIDPVANPYPASVAALAKVITDAGATLPNVP